MNLHMLFENTQERKLKTLNPQVRGPLLGGHRCGRYGVTHLQVCKSLENVIITETNWHCENIFKEDQTTNVKNTKNDTGHRCGRYVAIKIEIEMRFKVNKQAKQN